MTTAQLVGLGLSFSLVSLGSGGGVPQMMMNDYGAAGGFSVVV